MMLREYLRGVKPSWMESLNIPQVAMWVPARTPTNNAIRWFTVVSASMVLG